MPPSEIVSRMQTAAKAFENDEIGSRETLLELWGELRAELELPCQVISRLFYETVISVLSFLLSSPASMIES